MTEPMKLDKKDMAEGYGVPLAATARVPMAPGDMIVADLDSIQHIYATNEFERQVLSRISSKGFKAKQLSKYLIDNSEKATLDGELARAMTQVTNVQHKLNWKTNPVTLTTCNTK